MTVTINPNLFEIFPLSDLHVLDGHTYALRSHARETENDYVSDLVELHDGEFSILVEQVVQIRAQGQHLYYQVDNDIFRFHPDAADEKIVSEKTKITNFVPTNTGTIVYVTLVEKYPKHNLVLDKPTLHSIKTLTYKADNKGYIDTEQHYYLKVQTFEKHWTIVSAKTPLVLLDAFADSRVLYTRQTTSYDALYAFNELVEYQVAADKTFVISHDGIAEVSEAQYSTNGADVLFVAQDKQNLNHRMSALYRFNFAENTLNGIFQSEDVAAGMSSDTIIKAQARHLKWLDDDNFVFQTGYHGHSRLYIGDLSGAVTLIRDEREQIVDFAFDDAFAMVLRSTTDHPSQLIDLTTKAVQFDEHQTYPAAQKYVFLSENQAIIDAWFMPNQAGTQAPVILYVHGGPHAAYGDTFFLEFQQLTALGYNVVFINPHGSTTYGQAFMDAVIQHYGEQDYRDLMTGLDAAITQHPELIDATRQYIIGGSYGGYMTTWAIGHTTRFKAAIAQRPVTDWMMLAGTSDIGAVFITDEMGASPYDESGRQVLYRKSPIAYVKTVRTPILLLHGEYDMRTPLSQSEAYFTALKMTNDVEVELVRLPQSWHGVSRNGLPNLRGLRIEKMQSWLNHHQ
ncbi:alpha/beta hydrolase family protein [Weissella soli]|uniref:alpha/beta hydrolase family protein n=1 Tax=Weissella soli TaxID=155866 RepID=UPI0011BB35C5|nr:S9 family peptidase [Weissella soli]QEA34650.1 S9 family peptidase [Weissella soli]